MSTLGPYCCEVTTSGAIQYVVPMTLVRLALEGVSCAPNPKSAVIGQPVGQRKKRRERERQRTYFDATIKGQENVVALDVSVNDGVREGM